MIKFILILCLVPVLGMAQLNILNPNGAELKKIDCMSYQTTMKDPDNNVESVTKENVYISIDEPKMCLKLSYLSQDNKTQVINMYSIKPDPKRHIILYEMYENSYGVKAIILYELRSKVYADIVKEKNVDVILGPLKRQ